MERRGGHYSVTNCRNVGAMLGCRCDVSAFNLRRTMCRPSKIDDRCVDLRRSMCRLSKIDDRCADLRRSMALCRPSKTDDRCEIMLPHLHETLMVMLYTNCAEGLQFSAFIMPVFLLLFYSLINSQILLLLFLHLYLCY